MPNYSQVTCPHCNSPVFCDPQQAGQTIYCNYCVKQFRLPEVQSSFVSPDGNTMPGEKRTNGLAIASMVCGIVFFFPMCLLAMIFGIFGLRRTRRDPRYRGKSFCAVGLILGGLGMGWWCLYSFQTARLGWKELGWQVHLLQIHGACMAYCADNNGLFPPDLGTLAVVENLPAKTFLCGDKPAPDDLSSNQLAQWVNDNSDFSYAASHLNVHSDRTCVVASENVSRAVDDQVYVLYVNGEVEQISLDDLQYALVRSGASSPQ